MIPAVTCPHILRILMKIWVFTQTLHTEILIHVTSVNKLEKLTKLKATPTKINSETLKQFQDRGWNGQPKELVILQNKN